MFCIGDIFEPFM